MTSAARQKPASLRRDRNSSSSDNRAAGQDAENLSRTSHSAYGTIVLRRLMKPTPASPRANRDSVAGSGRKVKVSEAT